MTQPQPRLLLVVPESSNLTDHARNLRRTGYESVASKIGAELLVTSTGSEAQLLVVPEPLPAVGYWPPGEPQLLRVEPVPRLSPLLLGIFIGAGGAGLIGAALHLVGL